MLNVTYDMMDTKVSYTQNRANLPYSRSDWNQVHDAPVYVMSLQGISYEQEYRGPDSNQIPIFLSHTLHIDLLIIKSTIDLVHSKSTTEMEDFKFIF